MQVMHHIVSWRASILQGTRRKVSRQPQAGTQQPALPPQVLHHSYEFYEAQRSGALPPGSGPAWRGDSALADAAPNGAPLVGGWYDAGGAPSHVVHGKIVWAQAGVLTIAWAAEHQATDMNAQQA